MIDKLIKWAASKRGFTVEEASNLVIVKEAKEQINVIKMAVMSCGADDCFIDNMEGHCLPPGYTLKIYVSR